MSNTTIPLSHAMQMAQMQQLASQQQQNAYNPYAGQLAGLGSGLGTGLGTTTMSVFNVKVSAHYYHDAPNDTWKIKVLLAQGPTGQVFVLYDGPFPVTNEGLIAHFSSLTVNALVEEKI